LIVQNSQISSIYRDKSKREKAAFCSKLQQFSRKNGGLFLCGIVTKRQFFG